MASDEVVVKYNVLNPKDIPQIGQRKAVRVNGRTETLYVKRLTANAMVDYAEKRPGHWGHQRSYYGEVVLTPYSDLRR